MTIRASTATASRGTALIQAVLAAVTSSLLLLVFAGCAHTEPSGTASEERASPNTVSMDEIEDVSAVRLEELLIGRVAGVNVIRTSGGIAVRIRGTSSINGSNEPLYVVDGFPISSGPGGALTGINPRDVKSIEVLKNPSETAQYGVRGANGVVVVTTKDGRDE